MKKSVDITVDQNAFKELLNIFKLYNVPFKPIENGARAFFCFVENMRIYTRSGRLFSV
jgi:hypothetical protein